MAFDLRTFRNPSATQPAPERNDGLPDGRYGELFDNWARRLDYFQSTGESIEDTSELPLFMLEGTGAEAVATELRRVRDGSALQLTNTSDARLTVTLHLAEYPIRTALLDPVNGKTFVLRHEEGGAVRIAFAPGQTWIVCFGDFTKGFVFDGFHTPPGPRQAIATLDGEWRGGRLDPNVRLLRGASVTQPSEASDTFRLRYAVTVEDIPAVCELAIAVSADHASIAQRWERMLGYVGELPYISTTMPLSLVEQLRAVKVFGNASTITHYFGGGSFITTDVEAPAIIVNGQPVLSPAIECRLLDGWHHTLFYTADLSTLLTTGENEIEISSHTVEFENAYLLGDFAVSSSSGSIVKENNTFALGDLTHQGYLFYAGTFALETTVALPYLTRGSRYILAFPTFDAKVLRVIVNGFAFEPLLAQPWETDISMALRPGRNTVRIELTSRLTHPWGDGLDGSLTPFGLLAPPVIVEEERTHKR